MSYAIAITNYNYNHNYDDVTKHLVNVYFDEKLQKKKRCVNINPDLTNIPIKRIYNRHDGKHCYDLLTLVKHFEENIELQDLYTYPTSNERVTFNEMKRIANNIFEFNFYINKFTNTKFRNDNEKYKYAFENEIVEFNENKIPFIPKPIHIKSKLLNLIFLDLTNKMTDSSSIVKEILSFDLSNIDYNQTEHSPNMYLVSLKNSYIFINAVTVDFAIDFYNKYFPKISNNNLKDEILTLTRLIQSIPEYII